MGVGVGVSVGVGVNVGVGAGVGMDVAGVRVTIPVDPPPLAGSVAGRFGVLIPASLVQN